MNNIIACVDGSKTALAVCDAASWVAQRLEKPITLLHALERDPREHDDNLSGALGIGEQSHLLHELAESDEKRGKLARQQGQTLLDALQQRISQTGVGDIQALQRHGDLVENLLDLESNTRFVVAGRSGSDHEGNFKALGSHIEILLRNVKRPVILTGETFAAPTKFMLAYDGRETADRLVDRIFRSGLLIDLECHLVMVENKRSDSLLKLEAAHKLLEDNGVKTNSNLIRGKISDALLQYREENDIDLILMGAFSHSKIRQLLVGSTTAQILERTQVPVVIVR